MQRSQTKSNTQTTRPELQVYLDNPDLFILRYFPHRVKQLEDFHLRLLKTSVEEIRGLILYPATHGKCESKDTQILMKDGTLRNAGDIKTGDELASGTCIASESNGTKDTLKITLRTGHEIVCTKNHPFYISGMFIRADQLYVGQEVQLCEDITGLDEVPIENEEARLLGYFVGDGCTVKGNCDITTKDLEIVKDITYCAEHLGFEMGAVHGIRYAIKNGSRPWIENHGLKGKGSWDKRVPECIFKGTKENIRHFLAAYFSCDGSFSRATSGFEFYSVNKDLLKDVQHLLLRLGITASLSLKNGRYKGERHISWRLRVPSMGFDKISTWPIVVSRKRPPRTEEVHRFLPTISKIEENGEQETWAIQTSTGLLWTNDILTHNTTLVSTLLPIWALCCDPNIRIAIIAKNDDDAKGIMQSIHAELLANDKLIEDFGPFKSEDDDGKPWALQQLSVAKRTRRGKEATITVFGSGARTVLGHRTDWTICDDVVTEKNSSTPEQRNKLRQWFNQYVVTGPEEDDDRITVIGTRFDPDDLYGALLDLRYPDTGDKMWHVQYEDAIVSEENKTTLWPKRWSWKRLMARKAEMGTLDFNKRFRNIAVDASRMVFKEEYVKGGYIGNEKYPGCLDYNYCVGEFEDEWRRVAGFDPAIGVSRSTKFCAHLALAVGSCKEHERCFWVIDLEREQLSLPQQVDMILSKHQDYGLDASIVEANSYQAGLFQAVKQKMDDQGLAMRIEPHYTSRTNKPDPEVGVQSMSAWFENGKIHIPYGDVHSRRKMEQFIDELVQYPGKTTDTVMAFWFAWKYLQQSGPKYQSYNRLRKREWGKRMSKRVVKNPYYARDVDD